MPKYLTDGIHLYAIVRVQNVSNYGLRRETFTTVIVEDCATGALRRLEQLELALCDPVSQDRDAAAY